jgi:hypothetical protein
MMCLNKNWLKISLIVFCLSAMFKTAMAQQAMVVYYLTNLVVRLMKFSPNNPVCKITKRLGWRIAFLLTFRPIITNLR